MFKPIFSLGFILIWGALFTTVLGIVWWGTGQPPSNTFRAAVGVLAGIAAHTLETDLARRHARRGQPPRTHRKTPTGGSV